MQQGDRMHTTLWKRVLRNRWIYLVMAPAIIFVVIYRYMPIYGMVIAFKDYKVPLGILGSPWAGLKHFIRMFSNPTFIQVIRNTFIISLSKILFAFPAPIIFALFLNEIRILKVKKIFQTLSYLPHFVSWVVVFGLFKRFLSINGPINFIITRMGNEPVIFLNESSFFVPLLVLSSIWHNVGWGSIIYMAAITGIDPQLYEAAEIDGTNRFGKMLHITIPSLIPVIITVFLLRLGYILNAGFDQVINFYNPTVYSVGDIIDTYVYRTGLINLDCSYATAIGIFKNILGLSFLIIVNKVVNSRKEGGGLW